MEVKHNKMIIIKTLCCHWQTKGSHSAKDNFPLLFTVFVRNNGVCFSEQVTQTTKLYFRLQTS